MNGALALGLSLPPSKEYAVAAKLVKFGWTTEDGKSLDWRYWNARKSAAPVRVITSRNY
jgi:hypothetical protein